MGHRVHKGVDVDTFDDETKVVQVVTIRHNGLIVLTSDGSMYERNWHVDDKGDEISTWTKIETPKPGNIV